MAPSSYRLLLADDDTDDHIFFRDALDEFPATTHLTIVNNGVELMKLLNTSSACLPDMLFLDLNMPLKAGYECLAEIKSNIALKKLPVIIFSTSFEAEVANLLYDGGAHYYIRKPGEFTKLRDLIHKAILLTYNSGGFQPPKGDFLLYNN